MPEERGPEYYWSLIDKLDAEMAETGEGEPLDDHTEPANGDLYYQRSLNEMYIELKDPDISEKLASEALKYLAELEENPAD